MDQVSPRIFEAMVCGAFVISDKQKDVIALFQDGKHLVYFDSPNDLVEKIRYFLAYPELRKKVALNGMQEVHKNHTYVHRIQSLLSTVTFC